MTTPTSWVLYALQALGLSRPREYTYEEEKEYEPQSDPYVLRLGDFLNKDEGHTHCDCVSCMQDCKDGWYD